MKSKLSSYQIFLYIYSLLLNYNVPETEESSVPCVQTIPYSEGGEFNNQANYMPETNMVTNIRLNGNSPHLLANDIQGILGCKIDNQNSILKLPFFCLIFCSLYNMHDFFCFIISILFLSGYIGNNNFVHDHMLHTDNEIYPVIGKNWFFVCTNLLESQVLP